MKEPSKITHDMSEHERAEYLKNSKISIIESDPKNVHLLKKKYRKYKKLSRLIIRKELRDIGKVNNIFREYRIGDTNINAIFSIRNLYESVEKSTNPALMFYVIYSINQITKNLLKIEEHLDNKKDRDVDSTHEFICLLKYKKKNIC